jgi:hypothetical protein
MSAHRVLVYDCFSGIAGDMHIGAMVDLGVPEDYLRTQLARLPMSDEFTLRLEHDRKLGITGTRATVQLNPGVDRPARHLSDVSRVIEQADYPPPVTRGALAIFRRIAEAESHIHGISMEAIHFHEVGATDAIVDIVAAALCLDYLNADEIRCGPVELGGGMVRCEHGTMPVPAPATAEILKGVPCHMGRVQQEATTPTGAAILKHAVHDFSLPDGFLLRRIGYGIGQKDFSIPNVLRVMLGEVTTTPVDASYDRATDLQIDCNIDDMSPEAFGPLMDALFVGGAKDVFLTPIVMKKGRPATMLSVLCEPGQVDALMAILFAQSTTIGVRTFPVEKYMLPRTLRSVTTSLGEVRVKQVTPPGGVPRWKVEHDDIVRLAEKSNLGYLGAAKRIEREVSVALGENS